MTSLPSRKYTQSQTISEENNISESQIPTEEKTSTVSKPPAKTEKPAVAESQNHVPPTKPTEPQHSEPIEEPEKPYYATAEDTKSIADKVVEYINSYRATPATKLPGLTKYAEYRSRQLVSNFAHDTDDERAAATALKYGTYINPADYGIEGEPYYSSGARDAIVKGGYVGTVDYVAQRIATLVRNSSGHWAYVGATEYKYIGVGITYRSGMWYCDISMAEENTDNK